MGKLTISFDFELGWGAIETGLWKGREERGVYKDMRPALNSFAQLLDDINVSTTWATVGAMISNPSINDFDHLPKPYYKAIEKFLADAEDTTRNGQDLLEILLSLKTKQDIGSHSFSHTRFLVKEYTEAAKREEMKKSLASLEKFGVTPRSFVFPVNHVSNLDIFDQFGFHVARTPPVSPKTKTGKFWERVNGNMPSASRRIVKNDFYVENGTMLYHWGTRKNWKMKRALVKRQAKLGLEKASKSDYHFHLWLHPFNLVEIPHLLTDLSALLTKAAHLRDNGELLIIPMNH